MPANLQMTNHESQIKPEVKAYMTKARSLLESGEIKSNVEDPRYKKYLDSLVETAKKEQAIKSEEMPERKRGDLEKYGRPALAVLAGVGGILGDGGAYRESRGLIRKLAGIPGALDAKHKHEFEDERARNLDLVKNERSNAELTYKVMGEEEKQKNTRFDQGIAQLGADANLLRAEAGITTANAYRDQTALNAQAASRPKEPKAQDPYKLMKANDSMHSAMGTSLYNSFNKHLETYAEDFGFDPEEDFVNDRASFYKWAKKTESKDPTGMKLYNKLLKYDDDKLKYNEHVKKYGVAPSYPKRGSNLEGVDPSQFSITGQRPYKPGHTIENSTPLTVTGNSAPLPPQGQQPPYENPIGPPPPPPTSSTPRLPYKNFQGVTPGNMGNVRPPQPKPQGLSPLPVNRNITPGGFDSIQPTDTVEGNVHLTDLLPAGTKVSPSQEHVIKKLMNDKEFNNWDTTRQKAEIEFILEKLGLL